MATVASPQSSNLSNRVEGVGSQSNKSPYTPFPRKLKRLQSAYTDERHSGHTLLPFSDFECVRRNSCCGIFSGEIGKSLVGL